MFVAGISLYAALVFSSLSFLVAMPSAIKVFNWTATLYKGSITFETPMLFALGFVALFTVGGLTGLFLATLGMDMHVHDTYFVIAHFHFIMVGGMVMAYMGGLHYWWPKITGRMYSDGWSRLAALIIFVGFFLTFLPQFVRGLQRHAAPLPHLRARVPGVERPLHRRGLDPRRRLRAAAVLSAVLAALWQARPGRIRGARPGWNGKPPRPRPTDNFAETPVVVRIRPTNTIWKRPKMSPDAGHAR